MSLIRKLSCNVWRAGKDSRYFFVTEKQSSEEEMQPIKFFLSVFCVLDMQGIWKFRSTGS